MGILTFLQHKEAAVVEPAAKNTSMFIAETKEGAGENEVLAERPAIRAGANFFGVIMSDSRLIVAANAPAALASRTVAEAEGATGFEASATKHAFVTAFLEAKGAEEYNYKIEVAAVAGIQFKIKAAATEEVFNMGTYFLPLGKKIKVVKTTNEPKSFKFQATLLN